MKKTITAALAASLTMWGSASFAQPLQGTTTCSEVDGQTLLGSFGGFAASVEDTLVRAGSPSWAIDLEAGDRLSVVADNGQAGLEMTVTRLGELRSKDRTPLPFTIVASDTETVQFFGLTSTGVLDAGLPPRGGMPIGFPTIPDNIPPMPDVQVSDINTDYGQEAIGYPLSVSATISCSSGNAGEGLAGASTLNQTGTILNGLRNIRGRTGGTETQLSTQGLFGFSGDEVTGWRVWGFSEFRQFSNLADGGSFGVALGADRNVGPVRAGVLLSYDKTTLDTGLGDESVENVAFGPYVTGSAANFSYDAFVTMSRPSYDLIGDNLTGKRVSYGLAGEGSFDVGMAVLFPNIRLEGANEDLDGDTLKSNQLAAGMRVEFMEVEGVKPYLSIAYEGTRLESEITGKTEHAAPRFGLGFLYETEYGASLGLDIDGGETIEDLRDVGLRLSYSYNY